MTEVHTAAIRLAHELGIGTLQAQRLIARGRRQSTGTFAHQQRSHR